MFKGYQTLLRITNSPVHVEGSLGQQGVILPDKLAACKIHNRIGFDVKEWRAWKKWSEMDFEQNIF